MFMRFQLKIRKPFENEESWKIKNGFQHWRLINQVQAKEFTNPGGPPVFKLSKINGAAEVD